MIYKEQPSSDLHSEQELYCREAGKTRRSSCPESYEIKSVPHTTASFAKRLCVTSLPMQIYQVSWYNKATKCVHMGKIDNIAKKFVSDNVRFAEFFNYFIYNSEPVISPDSLKPAEIEEIVLPYGNGKKGRIQKYRDILKLWAARKNDDAIYVLLGVELEGKIHYAMPVRNMLYDAANYSKQIEARANYYRNHAGADSLTDNEFLSGFRKEDKLIPVITLVICLSSEEWDGPKTIHEMFDNYDERLMKLIPDYRINLLSPAIMSDEEMDKLIPDVDAVMRFIKYSGDKERLLKAFSKNPKYESITPQSVDLINAVTGSNIKYRTRKGKVNMCTAIEELRKEERQLGISEGYDQGLSQGYDQGLSQGYDQGQFQTLSKLAEKKLITVEQAADEAGMSVEEFLEKMRVS